MAISAQDSPLTSLLGTIGNLLACEIGLGMITLPLLFARAGLVGGALVLVFTSAWLGYLVLRLYRSMVAAEAALKQPIKTFPDLFACCFSSDRKRQAGRTFTEIFVFLDYALIISVMMGSWAKALEMFGPRLSSPMRIGIVGITSLPLSLVRSSRITAQLSILSVVGVSLLLGMVVAVGGRRFLDGNVVVEYDVWWRRDGNAMVEILASITNITFVLAAASVVPTVASSMKQPERFPTVTYVVFGLAVVIYLVVGISGYLGWGRRFLDSNNFRLLDGLAEGGKVVKVLMCVALLVIAVSQISVLALVLNQTVDQIVDRVFVNSGYIGKNCVRILLHLVEVGVVFLLPDVEQLIDLVSAVTTVVMVLIMPVIISWRWSSGSVGSRIFHGGSLLAGGTVLSVGLYHAVQACIH